MPALVHLIAAHSCTLGKSESLSSLSHIAFYACSKSFSAYVWGYEPAKWQKLHSQRLLRFLMWIFYGIVVLMHNLKYYQPDSCFLGYDALRLGLSCLSLASLPRGCVNEYGSCTTLSRQSMPSSSLESLFRLELISSGRWLRRYSYQ